MVRAEQPVSTPAGGKVRLSKGSKLTHIPLFQAMGSGNSL
jgi:hypothetical protein